MADARDGGSAVVKERSCPGRAQASRCEVWQAPRDNRACAAIKMARGLKSPNWS
jgi:hypothetical protein